MDRTSFLGLAQSSHRTEQIALRPPLGPTPDEGDAHSSAGHVPYRSCCRRDVDAAMRTFPESHAAGQVPTGAIACSCLEKCRSCPEGDTLSPRLVEK